MGIISGAIASFLVADVGVDAAVAAVAGDALAGAATGAAISGIEGGNPLYGALGGALTGGAIGAFGGSVGDALGIGTTGGDVLVGTAAGALGSGITGGNVLQGALGGAAAGGIAGLSTPGGISSGAASSPGGASSLSAAAPAGVASADPVDLTGGGGVGGGGGEPGFSGNAGNVLSAATGGGAGSGAGVGTGVASGSSVFNQLYGTGGGAGGGGNAAAGTGITSTGNQAWTPTGSTSSNDLTANVLAANGSSGGGGGAGSSGNGISISGGSDSGFLGNIGQSALNSITKNPLGTALAGGGLLYNLLGNKQNPNESTLQSEAGSLLAQGNQLQSYLQNGTLPPGAQTAINNAVQSAKAAIRSRYSSSGQTGSSAEVQELNQVDLNAASQAFTIANSLLQSGVNESQLGTGIYNDLIKLDLQQNQQTGSAIASFAAALSGGAQKAA